MRNQSENQVTLFFIRHGETPANRQKRYIGKTDEPLSPEGRAVLLAHHKDCPPADFLFTSPMLRCRQSAALLYPALPGRVIRQWEEIDFGDFEGKNYRELADSAAYQAWIDSGGTLPFPGGESREAFIGRCREGLLYCLQMLGSKASGQNLLENRISAALIVHGGTVMALLSTYGGGRYFDYACKNGDGYRCLAEFCTDARGNVREGTLRFTGVEPLFYRR